MDPELNPYASPLPDPDQKRFASEAGPQGSRVVAWLMIVLAVACGLIYTYLDEIVIRSSYGAWPVVFFTAALSLISAVATRDVWKAPLCCFLGTMSADLFAGILVNWAYAQVFACVGISCAFSLPALIVAALLRAYWPRIASRQL